MLWPVQSRIVITFAGFAERNIMRKQVRCNAPDPRLISDAALGGRPMKCIADARSRREKSTSRIVGLILAAVLTVTLPVGANGNDSEASPLSASVASTHPMFKQDSMLRITSQTSDSSVCAVTGRPIDDFIAAGTMEGEITSMLRGTPVATPTPPVSTIQADPDVVAAVTATMAEVVACANTGSLQRVAALFTDSYFYRFFGGIQEADVQRLATPTPLTPDQQQALVSVDEVFVLEDGRVSAVTQVNDVRALTIFAREGERYLIDYSYTLSEPATPAP